MKAQCSSKSCLAPPARRTEGVCIPREGPQQRAGTLPSDCRPPQPGRIIFCCLKATPSMLFCYSSLNRLRQWGRRTFPGPNTYLNFPIERHFFSFWLCPSKLETTGSQVLCISVLISSRSIHQLPSCPISLIPILPWKPRGHTRFQFLPHSWMDKSSAFFLFRILTELHSLESATSQLQIC